MAYLADPAGLFDSDTHRRVLGSLPLPSEDPITVTGLFVRISSDPHTSVGDVTELTTVLEDLKSSGYVEQAGGDWKQNEAGFDLLTGPIANDREVE